MAVESSLEQRSSSRPIWWLQTSPYRPNETPNVDGELLDVWSAIASDTSSNFNDAHVNSLVVESLVDVFHEHRVRRSDDDA